MVAQHLTLPLNTRRVTRWGIRVQIETCIVLGELFQEEEESILYLDHIIKDWRSGEVLLPPFHLYIYNMYLRGTSKAPVLSSHHKGLEVWGGCTTGAFITDTSYR